MQSKIQHFAEILERDRWEYMRNFSKGFTTDDDVIRACHYDSSIKVTVKPGKKYTKVDVGSSGKYMVVNETGEIYGIKAYGVIHKGHYYGTLDTIDQYYWGDYTASKRS